MADFDADRDLREFRRYSGDGLPGEPFNAPLPYGDPRSGRHHITQYILRQLLKQVEDGVATIEQIRDYIEGLASDLLAASEVPIFSTRTAVEGITVNPLHSVIRVNGRTTAGQGGAYYFRNNASTHPFKLTDANGAVFEPTIDPAPLTAFTGNTATVLNIGTGGHYPDLQSAVEAFDGYARVGSQYIELRIISPLTKGLLVLRDMERYRITSGMGTVTLAPGFNGVSNEFFESYGANTLAPVYKHAQNVIVGFRAKLPQLLCLIDMASPRGAGRLGHGISVQVGDVYIGGGAGVLNAGLTGITAQSANVFAIDSVFSGAGAENIRIQQAGTVTFQNAVADDGMMETSGGLPSASGAAVFVSRASTANLTNIKIRNSRGIGIETHGAFLRMVDAVVTGAASDAARFELGTHITAANTDFSGSGRDAVGVAHNSIVGLNNCNLSGCARYSLSMYGGGGIVGIEDATTKTGAPGVPSLADVSGVADFNWISPNGIVTANVDGPLQRLNIRGAGVFSNSGATNGKTFATAGILDSSRDSNSTTETQQHYRLYNKNGQVGTIATLGSSTIYATVSDGRLKVNRKPGEQEISALEFLMALQVWGYDWTTTGARDLGLIAQDLHKLKPGAVTVGEGEPGEDGFVPWAVDYARLMPEVILGVQALIENQSDLAARIAALEGAR